MTSFAEIDQKNNGDYLTLLSAISKLSKLFSESSIPYINYRVAENIFCKSFNADNLSRSDTAFDANYNSKGIGLKTFVCPRNNKNEKIAEFNQLASVLNTLKGKKLAIRISKYRNNRIDLAKRLYDVDSSIYHIVARKENKLILFETDYEKIDVNNVHLINNNQRSLTFEDGNHIYSFNYSKSTLFRKFVIPPDAFSLPIEIIDDPFQIILELFEDVDFKKSTSKLIKGKDYIILPLYGYKKGRQKFIFERSGLNQWNSSGRKRDTGEVYIPIPINININYPKFFPKRNTSFKLQIPTKEIFNAKVCQENSKALMTNPNKALANWLLRKILQLREGELATIEKLDKLGFDSVILVKEGEDLYKIDIMKSNEYEKFIFEEN